MSTIEDLLALADETLDQAEAAPEMLGSLAELEATYLCHLEWRVRLACANDPAAIRELDRAQLRERARATDRAIWPLHTRPGATHASLIASLRRMRAAAAEICATHHHTHHEEQP